MADLEGGERRAVYIKELKSCPPNWKSPHFQFLEQVCWAAAVTGKSYHPEDANPLTHTCAQSLLNERFKRGSKQTLVATSKRAI